MPTIFFVRDGEGDHHTSNGYQVAISQLEPLKSQFEVRFTKTGPTINGAKGSSSPFDPYRHVVAFVPASEISTEFPAEGYYLFFGLAPSDAEARFGISVP
jgi:hypothetical protein